MVAPFFTPERVARMHDIQLSSLTDSCAVYPVTTTTSATQGEIRDWPSSPAATIPCAELSQAAAITAGVWPDDASASTSRVIQVMREDAVNAGDRVVVNNNGVTWTVTGDPDRPGLYDQSYFLTCVKAPAR